MFIGEYYHNIDSKGRLIIPSKYRELLQDKFIITKGLDGCLFVYDMNKWNDISNKLNSLSFTKSDVRMFIRFFMSSAYSCELDSQGRINISKSLIEYAKIEKECIIIGAYDRLEIWNLETYKKLMIDSSTKISEIANNLFEGNW